MRSSALQSFVLLGLTLAITSRADGNALDKPVTAPASEALVGVPVSVKPDRPSTGTGAEKGDPATSPTSKLDDQEIEAIISEAIRAGLKHGLEYALGIPVNDDSFIVTKEEIHNVETCIGNETLAHVAHCIHEDLLTKGKETVEGSNATQPGSDHAKATNLMTDKSAATSASHTDTDEHHSPSERLLQCISPDQLEHIGRCIQHQEAQHIHNDLRLVDTMDESELLRLAQLRHNKDLAFEHFDHMREHQNGVATAQDVLTPKNEQEEQVLEPLFALQNPHPNSRPAKLPLQFAPPSKVTMTNDQTHSSPPVMTFLLGTPQPSHDDAPKQPFSHDSSNDSNKDKDVGKESQGKDKEQGKPPKDKEQDTPFVKRKFGYGPNWQTLVGRRELHPLP